MTDNMTETKSLPKSNNDVPDVEELTEMDGSSCGISAIPFAVALPSSSPFLERVDETAEMRNSMVMGDNGIVGSILLNSHGID